MLYSLKQHQAEAEQDCSLYSNHTDMRQLQVLYRGIEIHYDVKRTLKLH